MGLKDKGVCGFENFSENFNTTQLMTSINDLNTSIVNTIDLILYHLHLFYIIVKPFLRILRYQ